MNRFQSYSDTARSERTNHQKKQLDLLQRHGFGDEMLNCFKLDIYDDDVNKVLRYYKHDNFCHKYVIYKTCAYPKHYMLYNPKALNKNGPNVQINEYNKNKICRLQHTWTLFDLIHGNGDINRNINKAFLICKYLIYYTQEIELLDTNDMPIVNRLVAKLSMLYYLAATSLLPNIYIRCDYDHIYQPVGGDNNDNSENKTNKMMNNYNYSYSINSIKKKYHNEDGIDIESIEYYFEKSIEYNDTAKRAILIIYNKYAVFCGYFLNDYKKAVKYFDKCTIEAKDSFNAKWNDNGRQWYDYAIFCHRKLKNYQKSIQLFIECIQRSPNNGNNLYDFGLLYYEMGSKYYNESINYLKKSMDIKISQSELHLKSKHKKNSKKKYNQNHNTQKMQILPHKREIAVKLIKEMKHCSKKQYFKHKCNNEKTLKNISAKSVSKTIVENKQNHQQNRSWLNFGKQIQIQLQSQKNVNQSSINKIPNSKKKGLKISKSNKLNQTGKIDNVAIHDHDDNQKSRLIATKAINMPNHAHVRNQLVEKKLNDPQPSHVQLANREAIDTSWNGILSNNAVWKQEFDLFWNSIEFNNNNMYKEYYYEKFVEKEYNSIVLISCMNQRVLFQECGLIEQDCKYFIKYKCCWMKSHLKFIAWLHQLKLFNKYFKSFKEYGILNNESLMRKTNKLDTKLLKLFLMDWNNTDQIEQDICTMQTNAALLNYLN